MPTIAKLPGGSVSPPALDFIFDSAGPQYPPHFKERCKDFAIFEGPMAVRMGSTMPDEFSPSVTAVKFNGCRRISRRDSWRRSRRVWALFIVRPELVEMIDVFGDRGILSKGESPKMGSILVPWIWLAW